MTQPVALITGCSSGIGRALADAFQAAGYCVWASARKAAGSHDVAWLSGEGWFCACPAGTRCPAIKAVREALSVAARPTKAVASTC